MKENNRDYPDRVYRIHIESYLSRYTHLSLLEAVCNRKRLHQLFHFLYQLLSGLQACVYI